MARVRPVNDAPHKDLFFGLILDQMNAEPIPDDTRVFWIDAVENKSTDDVGEMRFRVHCVKAIDPIDEEIDTRVGVHCTDGIVFTTPVHFAKILVDNMPGDSAYLAVLVFSDSVWYSPILKSFVTFVKKATGELGL